MEYLAWGAGIIAAGIALAFVVGGACRLGATNNDSS